MAPCITLAKLSYPSSVLVALKMVVIAETHLEQSLPWTLAANANTTIVVESFIVNDDLSNGQVCKKNRADVYSYTDVNFNSIFK